jgi:hypothetical protein
LGNWVGGVAERELLSAKAVELSCWGSRLVVDDSMPAVVMRWSAGVRELAAKAAEAAELMVSMEDG